MLVNVYQYLGFATFPSWSFIFLPNIGLRLETLFIVTLTWYKIKNVWRLVLTSKSTTCCHSVLTQPQMSNCILILAVNVEILSPIILNEQNNILKFLTVLINAFIYDEICQGCHIWAPYFNTEKTGNGGLPASPEVLCIISNNIWKYFLIIIWSNVNLSHFLLCSNLMYY